ncbi:mRNA interferase RelE/StbE [Thermoanaerobacter thermohydrosulfuricus]|jgi:mRNA interferase RelE/StbE|uniref:mRNA interferase RelE/StbE n=1 Tax=Thermoanaerobacter thermohydrosulfuricus TaxID=1516 RepID=A0A1G7T9N6_THETY|nr:MULTISPECIES: type II toxin-antitoxin system RelE/ParE family toxin [Thermoanaerobacter]UZQ81762.1 type II toxin-antitoxin system RelE/ParE family toxin [Thermoanaerobacter sp. RKWS2]SDG31998.1 mRNA interferase RelE/StbE [Thermoanaerobacter thermohydrosulfuricus]
MYKIKLAKEAVKFVEKCDSSTKEKIKEAIERIAQSPYIGKNIKKLKGKFPPLYRYRVGNIRIIYQVQEKEFVFIVTIGYRKDVYKKL